MADAKVKSNYRSECGSLASDIPGLVLVPGMKPEGQVVGYEKQGDGSLREWGSWSNWRDACCYLEGYVRGGEDASD